MNKKLLSIVAVSLTLVVVAVIIKTVFFSFPDTLPIDLPPSATEQSGDNSNVVAVTPENVQTVLSSINCLEEYSREYTVTSYWAGGSSVADIKLWQNGDRMRISHKQGDGTKNIIISNNTIYIWYSDSDQLFSASVNEHDSNSLDRYARLITYREILDIPAEQVSAAGYEEKLGENCIYAKYELDNSYVNHIFVSVDTGLLVAAEVEQNGNITYQMSSLLTTAIAPDDNIFVPPTK